MSQRDANSEITPDLMLRAYATGIFPMAESKATEAIFWISPRERGILPLDNFHVSKSLRKTVRQNIFQIRCNTAFAETLAECSRQTPERSNTWINASIERCVNELHARGFAHSIECWLGGKLVGGLYGISLGAAFFGESMFSRVANASKVALVHLIAHLKLGGYQLLDTQFTTNHLERLGVIQVPASDYQIMLEEALKYQAIFPINATGWEWKSTLDDVLLNSLT